MKKRYNKSFNGLLILKALQFFVENPYDEIYLREFGRKLNISVNSAQRFLNLFVTKGLIVEFRKGNLRYFKANLNSIVFRNIKLTFSLKKIEDAGLIDFLNRKKFSNVVLFGSVARGLDDNQSDIDLVCIGFGKKFDCGIFEKKLKRQINLHIFTLAEWKNVKKENKAFYQDIISTGINLIGELPVLD